MQLKRSHRAALVAVVVAASTSAPSPGAPVLPNFSALPVADIPTPPDAQSIPPRIGASEHVAGLEIGSGIEPRTQRASRRPSDVALVSTALGEACLTDLGPRRIAARAESPIPFTVPTASSVPREKSRLLISEGVHALRLQRLVESPARTYLEVTDAWVDTQTLGARLHEHTEIPLVSIARGPLGSQVFAFRATSHVWIVVEVPERGVVVGPQPGSHSACGHVLVDLDMSPNGAVASFLIGARTPAQTSRARRFSATQMSASLSRSTRDSEPVLSITIARAPREVDSAVAAMLPPATSGEQLRKPRL
jgi:hypothetical protein